MAADPLSPGQIRTRGWPVLHAGSVPRDLAPANWTLRVHGEVEHPETIGFAGLLRLPQKDQVCHIHCVTSWSKVGMRWSGVPFQALVERVRPTAAAGYVILECEQGFTTSLPLSALLDDDVLLAHSADGAPLSSEHGGPVRMLVSKRYFYKSAKWLRALRFVTGDEPGFGEVRGYSNIADPWRATRYDVDDKRRIYTMRRDALFKPVTPTSADL